MLQLFHNQLFLWCILTAGGFLFGSVLFSKLLPLLLFGRDVSAESGDRNPGAANAFATCGVAVGMLCLLLDMFKGFLPVLLGRLLLDTSDPLFALVILAPVLGHAIAPFNRFHGGKCIATSFGVTIALMPQCLAAPILAVLYILFSTVVRIRSHRRRSIITFGAFIAVSVPLLLYVRQISYAIACVAIALTAIYKHLRAPAEAPKPVPQEETQKEPTKV